MKTADSSARIWVSKLIMTVLSVVGVDLTFGLSTYHPLNLLFFLVIWKIKDKHILGVYQKRERTIVMIVSGCITLMTVMANYEQIMSLELIPELAGSIRNQYSIRIAAVIVSFVGILYWVYPCMNLIYQKMNQNFVCSAQEDDSCGWMTRKKIFWITFFVGVILDLIVFMGVFPGILPNDAVDQSMQAYGARAYSNHHPWIHTLLIRLCFEIGSLITDNINVGVAIYTIIQLLLMNLIYAYVMRSLYEFGVKKKYLLTCMLFYVLIPYNVMYNLTMWKDTLFSAVCLLLTIEIWKLSKGMQRGLWGWVRFLLWGILMCLLRGNGFFAYLFTIFLMFFSVHRYWKQVLTAGILTIVVTGIVKGPVMDAFAVTQTDTIESLSIPAQQIARVVVDGFEITTEQRELLEQIIEVDKIAQEYNPIRSDEIKNLVRASGNQQYLDTHKWEYLKLWVQLGVKHPLEFVKAWIDQTRGYLYPDIQNWSIAYRIQENELGIVQVPVIGAIFQVMQYITCLQFVIPGYSYLWSIGSMVWVMLILIGRCLIKKEYKKMACYAPAAGVWITLLIATPVYAEFRYLYALFIALPVLLIITFLQDEKEPCIGEVKGYQEQGS